jgi:hypothetical protein
LAISLKTQNLPALATGLLVNLALFYGFALDGAFDVSAMLARLATWKTAIPGPLAIILVGIITEQFSAETKARIIFWRWRNPLPGSRAFSKYGPRDSRVDMNRLRSIVGTLPVEPEEQNRVWYQQLYKKVKDELSVVQAHKRYLFYRDYAAISFLLAIVLPIICLWQHTPTPSVTIYTAIMVVQFLVICNAGRTSGIRFVTTVMACV